MTCLIDMFFCVSFWLMTYFVVLGGECFYFGWVAGGDCVKFIKCILTYNYKFEFYKFAKMHIFIKNE